MNLYRQIKLYFLRRKRKRLQREREEMERDKQVFLIVARVVSAAIMEWVRSIPPESFRDEKEFLQYELKRAIESEDYELAAVLRDKIKKG